MSGGGFLALVYVHRYPEAIRGLILDSSCACFRERLRDPDCIASPFHPMWREPLATAGLAPGAAGPETSYAGSGWIALAGGADAFVAGGNAPMVSPVPASPALRRATPAMLAYDARPWLAEIRVPVLVLCGTSDPFVPFAHSRDLHSGIPGAELAAIEGAGHVPSPPATPGLAPCSPSSNGDRPQLNPGFSTPPPPPER
jgi:pimeloyl-ACP methyl ester carboxylesterase